MKLIFIDDEDETRKGIEKYINWNKLGIDSFTAFSNPFEAIAFAEKEHPDIVLSDIRMPQMDGISLCRRILEKSPSANIIFMSGYSDKEYLMDAIALSAVDYIEKPVNIQKLEAAIEKAVCRLMQTHSQKQYYEDALEIIQKNQQLYVNQLVMKLIHGLPLQEHISALGNFPLNNTNHYRVYLWRSRPNVLNLEALLDSMYASLAQEELLPSYIRARKDERTVLVIARFLNPLMCCSQKIDDMLSDRLCQERMTGTVSCAYGRLLQGLPGICESYRQAVIASQGIFFDGYGTILAYSDTPSGPCLQNRENQQDICQAFEFPDSSVLCNGLIRRDKTACDAYIEQVYSICRKRRNLLPNMIRNEYFHILSVITKNTMEFEKIAKTSFQQTDYLREHILLLETLEECHHYVKQELERFFNNVNEMVHEKKIILEVMRYIQDNYSDHNLMINQIAQYVYMTPNYLSTLFKRETGKTIGTYITETRMAQAKQLLSQTNMRLGDIVLAVGYTDTNYFSKLFKKYYHMSPSEYRNRTI